MRPDKSYDLDGDGFVSQKDYFLAKHFDKDNDGKLNHEETKNAHSAMKDGFDKKFRFGLERPGISEEIRQNTQMPKHIRVI